MPSPFFKVLKEHIRREKVSFHTPGHKQGKGFPSDIKKFLRENIFKMDLTVLSDIDSIHFPKKELKKAEEFLSRAYNSKYSFFLMNGSTIGNHAAILSQFSPGDSILVSRLVHRSVVSGIILSQIWPVWMQPEVLKGENIILECNSLIVRDYLEKFPEAKAVFITSPTYNGIIPDIRNISEIVHKKNKMLIVDEAWGPHLKFLDKGFSAVEQGADIVIHSFHKIFPVFSQGSVLHVLSDRVDLEKLEEVLSFLHTTSPFYPNIALMDWVRDYVEKKGRKLVKNLMRLGEYTIEKLKKVSHIKVFEPKILPEGYKFDSSKITFDVSNTGYTGYEIDRFLLKKGISVDCAGYTNVIAPLGFGSDRRDIDYLLKILRELNARKKPINFYLWLPRFLPEMALLPYDVIFKYKRISRNIFDSQDMISGEIISPYPPGIPILTPGERITKDVCNYFKDLLKRNIIDKEDVKVVEV